MVDDAQLTFYYFTDQLMPYALRKAATPVLEDHLQRHIEPGTEFEATVNRVAENLHDRTPNAIIQALQKEGYDAFLAFQRDELVFYAALRRDPATRTIHGFRFFTVEEHRSRGIATRATARLLADFLTSEEYSIFQSSPRGNRETVALLKRMRRTYSGEPRLEIVPEQGLVRKIA